MSEAGPAPLATWVAHVDQLLSRQMDEIQKLLSTPRPTVLIDRDAYMEERRLIADTNFKHGVTRGKKNLIYYISAALRGDIALEELPFEELDPEEVKILHKIVSRALKGGEQ